MKKMLVSIVVIILSLSLSACNNEQVDEHQLDGFTFSVPHGWSREDLKNNFISFEPNPGSDQPPYLLVHKIESSSKKPSYDEIETYFENDLNSNIQKSTVGDYPMIEAELQLNGDGNPAKGKEIAFYSNDESIVIITFLVPEADYSKYKDFAESLDGSIRLT